MMPSPDTLPVKGQFHFERPEQCIQLNKHHSIIVVKNKLDAKQTCAIRLRVGRARYSEWLNELQVYLLPNFKHVNILDYYGADKLIRSTSNNNPMFATQNLIDDILEFSTSVSEDENFMDDSHDEEERQEQEQEQDKSKKKKNGKQEAKNADKDDDLVNISFNEAGDVMLQEAESSTTALIQRSRVPDRPRRVRRRTEPNKPVFQYWILNEFSGCITLRHYLMMHTVSWGQMLHIAKGIFHGLNFLHEQNEYQNYDVQRAVDGFIRSTHGALKKVSFVENNSSNVIHMRPHFCLSIIHRNLTSLNIVLKSDFTPCIWDFGHSHVHHPFQPANLEHLIDKASKKVHLNSAYSPPEVLQEKGHMTLASMKSIDMYASGMLLWELMSRLGRILMQRNGARL